MLCALSASQTKRINMVSVGQPGAGEIPKAVFRRLVKEIIADQVGEGELSITKDALAILQMDVESRMTDLFTLANSKAVAGKRQTLKVVDYKQACLEELTHRDREAKSEEDDDCIVSPSEDEDG